MRCVIQRVKESAVYIQGKRHASTGAGLLLLAGVASDDNHQDIDWLVKKIINLRIFNNDRGVMDLSIAETGGDIMLISQFTLHASTRKGNRPSYIKAARPSDAIEIYEEFARAMAKAYPGTIKTGVFGADMQVSLVNDGPVTIIIDSKLKE